MSHEITNTDNFAEVRKSGRKAWHGLGEELPEGLSAVDATRRAGLDWRTELVPVYADIPSGAVVLGPDGTPMNETTKVEVPGSRLHYRLDNGDALGLVSDKYSKIENETTAEFADELAGLDAAVTVETVGTLRGGKKFFVLVKLPTTFEVAPGDANETFTLVGNAHGGHGSFFAYPTSVRVVCANTLRLSERDAAKGVRFNHYGDITNRMAAAKSALGAAMGAAEAWEEKARFLVKSNLSPARAIGMLDELYDSLFGDPTDEGLVVTDEKREKLFEKKRALLATWTELLHNERNALPGIEGTKWAVYNAVSEWSDHERGNTEKFSKTRVHSNLLGASHETKRKALAFVTAAPTS